MMRIAHALGCVLIITACASDNNVRGTPSGNPQADQGMAGTAPPIGGGPRAGSGFAGSGGSPSLPTGDGGTCEVGKLCKPTDPDSDDCGSLTLEGDVEMVEIPGNVLLVFDRSGSMEQDWNGMPRWQAAGTAMVNALTPIQDKITIGAVLFPSPETGGMMCAPGDWVCMWGGAGRICGVNPIASPDQIAFKPGPQALAELAGPPEKYKPVAGGATPTKEGVQRADEALNAATLTGTTAAVIITDGDPNCSWDQAVTRNVIDGWLQKGIKTYVVGLPGVGGQGMMILEGLAQAGGTTTYLTPANSADLEQKMRDIVQTTVSVGFDSCTIHLDPAAAEPDKLHLVVKNGGVEQAVPHTYPSGEQAWTITPDGTTVELLGNTCEAAKNGVYESIRFEFGCVDLPPAPPPPPIE